MSRLEELDDEQGLDEISPSRLVPASGEAAVIADAKLALAVLGRWFPSRIQVVLWGFGKLEPLACNCVASLDDVQIAVEAPHQPGDEQRRCLRHC